jgi:phage baseplate assembly protein W
MGETQYLSLLAIERDADDPATSLWRGPAVPFYPQPRGHFRAKGTRAVIVASILHILNTRIGSRVRQPTFGSRLPELVFDPNDDLLIELARSYVEDALNKWEPRISVDDVEVFRDNSRGEVIHIRVVFTVKSLSEQMTVDTRLIAPGTAPTVETSV